MFKFFTKKEEKILSPADGEIISLEDVPDPVFSEKMLGEGFAVIPENGVIYAPVSGTLTDVTDTLHAYCITTRDGLDVLVHVGINTVTLKGEGFSAEVKSGGEVKAGDVLCRLNLKFIKDRGCTAHTPVIITNPEVIKSMTVLTGAKKARDTAVTYVKK